MNSIIKGLVTIMMLSGSVVTLDVTAAEGVEVNHLGVNNTLVRITGEGRYLLLPVQESNDDARINVLVDGRLDRSITMCRLTCRHTRVMRW